MTSYELIFGFLPETKAKFPWLFSETPIDRHGAERIVPMKVLNLSLGRTGTNSMRRALELLGYPTYHGFDIHANPLDCDMWVEALDAKYQRTQATRDKPWTTEDWRRHFDQLLGHVGAVTDLPCNMFAAELIAAYPDAKVILVERDVDAWYKSWEKALIQSLEIPFLDVVLAINKNAKRMCDVAVEGTMKLQFGAKDTAEYRANAKPTYRKHYAEIRAIMKKEPKDRLLEYKLGSGWKPICEFLGVEQPDEEFPFLNESATHEEMGEIVKMQMLRHAAGFFFKFVMPVIVLVMAWYWQAGLRRLASRFLAK